MGRGSGGEVSRGGGTRRGVGKEERERKGKESKDEKRKTEWGCGRGEVRVEWEVEWEEGCMMRGGRTMRG